MRAQPVSATSTPPARIGCAGWALRQQHAGHFSGNGTHLQRYAGTFNAVEINSSFYRAHRRATYERWAASVPDNFRFSVKLPKEITHVRRLVGAESLLDSFLYEIAGLGPKLGPVLVQLPSKFDFNAAAVTGFVDVFRERFAGDIAWEPRNETWFSGEVGQFLSGRRVSRVAADPARVPEAALPGGWNDLIYFRLHGSPRTYYSTYTSGFIAGIAASINVALSGGKRAWCIFDNTVMGAATENALALKALLSNNPE